MAAVDLNIYTPLAVTSPQDISELEKLDTLSNIVELSVVNNAVGTSV